MTRPIRVDQQLHAIKDPYTRLVASLAPTPGGYFSVSRPLALDHDEAALVAERIIDEFGLHHQSIWVLEERTRTTIERHGVFGRKTRSREETSSVMTTVRGWRLGAAAMDRERRFISQHRYIKTPHVGPTIGPELGRWLVTLHVSHAPKRNSAPIDGPECSSEISAIARIQRNELGFARTN